MSGGIQHLQKCYILGSDDPKPLTVPQGYSCFEHGGFLTTSGDDTNYFWAATNDKLSIFTKQRSITTSKLLCEFAFGEQAKVIDCVYFAINRVSPGVAVLINDTSLEIKQFYVAYISLTKGKILKKILLNYSAHSLYSVSDGAQYDSQIARLHQTFQDHWPHILAVSCFGVGAILLHFGISDEENIPEEVQFERPQHCIVLGKLFLTKNSDRFLFKGDGNKVHEGPISNLYVTSFLFIEKSGVLVMGFPFGGIFTVSLRNQRQKSYFLIEGAVEGITMQFADDDPRGLYYLWFVFVKRDKSFSIGAQCIFQEEDERSGNFDNPTIAFGLSFVLKDCIQFINARTIAIDRCKLSGVTRENSEPSHDDSIIDNKKSLSLTLYTWYGQSGNEQIKLYGALYDLNMYYTKRIPSQMNPDNTLMKQIPYVCGFVSDGTIDLKKFEIMDLMIDPTSILAFMSVESENIDQLFYPSALHFNLMALTATFGQNFTVNSIQDQYLMLAGKNIVESWKEPTEMLVKLYSLGLCNRPFQGNDRRLYLLDTFLRHGYHDVITGFIERPETTYDDLKFIMKWINKEVEVAKEKLDKSAELLFNATGISNSALLLIRNSSALFRNISDITDTLIKKMLELKNENDIQLLKVNLSVVKGLYQYSVGINFGLAMGFLPQKQSLTDANHKLKEHFKNKCKVAVMNKQKLEIVRIIEECMQFCKNEDIWHDETAIEWYPPEQYTTWLSLWLNVELSISAKVTLFGYYMCDLDEYGLWTFEKLFDKSIGSFLQLEQDKMLVLRRKIDNIYKSDIRITKQIQLPEVFKRKVEKSEYEKVKELPTASREEFKIAKAKFLELPYGLHYFNLAMIEKRSFWLIQPANDIPKPNEPEDVKRSRIEVEKIKKTHGWMFAENRFTEMAEKWADGVDQNIPIVSPKKMELFPNKNVRKRTIAEIDDTVEEDFVIITPAKKDRKSIFMDTPAAKTFELIDGNGIPNILHSPVVNSDVKNTTLAAKHMERVKKITTTPLATPRANKTRNVSPEPSTPRVQPTSILKSNKKESRLKGSVKRTRLQFEDTLEEVRSIPNRHEQKAQLPDHFTMDDSITSETDFQLAQNAENDDENPRMDLSIVPIRLSLDEVDEEAVDDDEKPTEMEQDTVDDEEKTTEMENDNADDEESTEIEHGTVDGEEKTTEMEQDIVDDEKKQAEIEQDIVDGAEKPIEMENDNADDEESTEIEHGTIEGKEKSTEMEQAEPTANVAKEVFTRRSSPRLKKVTERYFEEQDPNDFEEETKKEKRTDKTETTNSAKNSESDTTIGNATTNTTISTKLNKTTQQWLEAHQKPTRKRNIVSLDDELLFDIPKNPKKSTSSSLKTVTKSPKKVEKTEMKSPKKVEKTEMKNSKKFEKIETKSPKKVEKTETITPTTPESKKRGRPRKIKE